MDAITKAKEVAAKGPFNHSECLAYPGTLSHYIITEFNTLRDGFLAAMAELEALAAIGEYMDSRCVDDTNPCCLTHSDGSWSFVDWDFWPEELNGGESFMEHTGTAVAILAEIARMKVARAEEQIEHDKEQDDA